MLERRGPTGVESLGLGERLRNAREARGLSLEQVAEVTRIRAIYLQALEEEQFDRLPGRIYLRGFLRAYAAALGLDPDDLLDAYPQLLNAPAQPIVGVHSVEAPIRPTARPSRLRRVATYIGLIALVAFLVLGYIGYQQMRRLAATEELPQTAGLSAPHPSKPVPPQEPPSSSAPVARTPAPAPSPTPQTQSTPPRAAPAPPAAQPVTPPSPPRPAPVSNTGGVSATLRASETSWVRIVADGAVVFEGFIQAGEVRTWRALQRLTVRVGRAPVVSIAVNGRTVTPPAGQLVWEQTFTAP